MPSRQDRIICDGRLLYRATHVGSKWEFHKTKICHRRRCWGPGKSEWLRGSNRHREKIVSWPKSSCSCWKTVIRRSRLKWWPSDIQYLPYSCQILWHLSVKILLSVIFIFGCNKRAENISARDYCRKPTKKINKTLTTSREQKKERKLYGMKNKFFILKFSPRLDGKTGGKEPD